MESGSRRTVSVKSVECQGLFQSNLYGNKLPVEYVRSPTEWLHFSVSLRQDVEGKSAEVSHRGDVVQY